MRFRAAPQYQQYVTGRLALAPSGPVAGSAEATGRGGAPRVSPLRQFGILARRYVDLIVQDRRNLLILLLQAPIIGLLSDAGIQERCDCRRQRFCERGQESPLHAGDGGGLVWDHQCRA